eukprot:gene15183-biopygen3674
MLAQCENSMAQSWRTVRAQLLREVATSPEKPVRPPAGRPCGKLSGPQPAGPAKKDNLTSGGWPPGKSLPGRTQFDSCPCSCTAVAPRLRCGCAAAAPALRLRCGCTAAALRCSCAAAALRVQLRCGCTADALQQRCGNTAAALRRV